MYKKLIILSGLYLLNNLPISGQHRIDYRFGLIGGLNAALIQKSTGIQNIRWRYNMGLTLEQRFSPTVSLVYQLLYSRQGETVNLKYGGTGPTIGHQYITFDYMTLPIMVRFRPKGEQVFLELGGQVSTLVNNYIYITDPFNQGKPFDNVNQLDVGFTGGLGYRFGKHIVVDTRYYHGTKPILSDFTVVNPQSGVPTLYRQEKWFNRVYSLNLSYYF
ncbi:porin family protein [Spirosoma sp.]|uniref:porin family protein n=1 Tax=Spirosoma sp. TaxID=1899569 RepID=UPI002605B8F9|nr:porin family protein [Spirosoma sp.]MCX6214583.1 porin family protein [Spirosoma sp.]